MMIYNLFSIVSFTFLTGAAGGSNLSPQEQLYQKNIGYYLNFKSECNDCGDTLFLTPLIKANKLEEARRKAYVNLTDFISDVDSYAGYLTVNERHNGNLFFWYFPVMNKPIEETPLILWLQGGPGDSSMFGLFREIGPFTVTDDMKLKKKEFSWAKDHSLLFIDNPVGTGFSFADEEGYATNQTTIGENLYAALQQFMTLFPQLRRVPLVIAGESYAGKHVPSLAIQVHWHRHKDQPINFKGISIGNGFIDPITLQSTSRFFAEAGLVDNKTADKIKEIEEECVAFINEGDSFNAHYKFIEAKNVSCDASQLNVYNFLTCRDLDKNYVKFVNMPAIRRALHVGSIEFHDKNRQVYNLLTKTDFMFSAKPWLNELLDHYKVLLYNGHLDMMVPYHASVNTYNSLKFSGANEYRSTKRKVWKNNGVVAGYYKKAGNFLEVMVRGAGHMVPMDQPDTALALVSSFVNNLLLK